MTQLEKPTAQLRSRVWTKAQRLEFGRRLSWAQEKAGYRFAADAIEALETRFGMATPQRSTYYSHKAGDRVPDDDEAIARYAELFKVSVDFLLLKEGWAGYQSTDSSAVNQAVEHIDLNVTNYGPVRYIPLLTASDIKSLLSGKGNLTAMSGQRVPVSQLVAAGPRSFAYQIPDNDHSMVGPEGSYGPGFIITIDQDRPVEPGAFLLAWPAGMDAPVFRRLRAAFPVSQASPKAPFELVALSPYAAPIRIDRPEDCQIIGRAIAFTGVL